MFFEIVAWMLLSVFPLVYILKYFQNQILHATEIDGSSLFFAVSVVLLSFLFFTFGYIYILFASIDPANNYVNHGLVIIADQFSNVYFWVFLPLFTMSLFLSALLGVIRSVGESEG